MTVAELMSKLKDLPQDATVYAEGEPAEAVCIEGYDRFGLPKKGFAQVVRIYKPWETNLYISPATKEQIKKWGKRNVRW